MQNYLHVDVFTSSPYGGNSLAVFPDAAGLDASQMLRITQELRHFESVFLLREPLGRYRARVFDLASELPFAGHPLLGAAAVLHDAGEIHGEHRHRFLLAHEREVVVRTKNAGAGVFATLDQGLPDHLGEVAADADLLALLGLSVEHLHPGLPMEIISTGLKYLIVPVTTLGLGKIRFAGDIGAALSARGAAFAVFLDEDMLEIRHWNNDGVLEDIATGSAAGTIGAYRLRHGLAGLGERFRLRQGRQAGRESHLEVTLAEREGHLVGIEVGGEVQFVGTGTLTVLPQPVNGHAK